MYTTFFNLQDLFTADDNNQADDQVMDLTIEEALSRIADKVGSDDRCPGNVVLAVAEMLQEQGRS